MYDIVHKTLDVMTTLFAHPKEELKARPMVNHFARPKEELKACPILPRYHKKNERNPLRRTDEKLFREQGKLMRLLPRSCMIRIHEIHRLELMNALTYFAYYLFNIFMHIVEYV
jgi:hypothetical protein